MNTLKKREKKHCYRKYQEITLERLNVVNFKCFGKKNNEKSEGEIMIK